MQKKRLVVILLVAIFSLMAVFAFALDLPGVNSPETTVQDFYNAIERNDIIALYDVATDDLIQLLLMFGDKAREAIMEEGKIKSMTHTINGDKAVVNITFDSGQTSNLDLIRLDGKWKVSVGK